MKPAPSPEAFSRYIQNYDSHTSGNSLAGRVMAKGHIILEKTIAKDHDPKFILEVGSGTGQHIRFVKDTFEKYYITDSNDEMLELARKKIAPNLIDRVVFDKQNASQTTYADNTFDRLIASHVLEHIPNPVDALKEWDRIVKPGGIISIILPCDPGMLWRFGRHLGPRQTALKAGLEYDYNQAAEHVNSIFNLVVFIRYHFENIIERWYPFGIPQPDINLFYLCHILK